jgi:hypothetical protein
MLTDSGMMIWLTQFEVRISRLQRAIVIRIRGEFFDHC